jgi:hypothetical protein
MEKRRRKKGIGPAENEEETDRSVMKQRREKKQKMEETGRRLEEEMK